MSSPSSSVGSRILISCEDVAANFSACFPLISFNCSTGDISEREFRSPSRFEAEAALDAALEAADAAFDAALVVAEAAFEAALVVAEATPDNPSERFFFRDSIGG